MATIKAGKTRPVDPLLSPDPRMEAIMRAPTSGVPATTSTGEDDESLIEPPPYSGVEDDEDPDVLDANNPDVQNFGEAPLLGGRRTAKNASGDVFDGMSGDGFGRATSPKLYAQAAQFPDAVQYRVWRWENGIPSALGAIDSEATEEDFVRQFYNAMPRTGDGRFQFRFRPVDIRGRELGKEFTLNFSEHHSEVVRVRLQKEREREEKMGNGHGEPILINQGDGSGGQYAEEMGRMFEQAVESAERRTEVLQRTLEDERGRLREEEKSRYEERARLADRSSDVTLKLTEKLMASDKTRSDEQMKAQAQQSGMLLQTLTTVFSQQQSSAQQQSERQRESDRQSSERQREMDSAKLTQDREFFDRQRAELESRRLAERGEWDKKRAQDKEEGELRLATERARLEVEQKRIEEQRKFELEQLRMEASRRETEAERRRVQEREELQARADREKLEMVRQQDSAKDERDRWRFELEEKRRSEREEWERRRSQDKEDAERRERSERDRMERERQDFQLRMEREKQESERMEIRRKEEMDREAARRREEIALSQKQMELSAQRDREHAERQLEMSRMERETSREAQALREKQEREARDFSDRERQRQQDLAMKQLENDRNSQREHAERMHQLQTSNGSGGLGGLGTLLNMEAPEILARIFGKGGGDEPEEKQSGWADAIPKVLGTIAELGKAAMVAQAEKSHVDKGRRQIAIPEQNARLIQTADGPRVILPGANGGIPLRRAPVPVQAQGLPNDPAIPRQFRQPFQDDTEAPPAPPKAQDPAQPAPPEQVVPESTMALSKKAGISLLDQKKARKALRVLVGKLGVNKEDEWLGLITEAITGELSIFAYIKAVSIEAALDEASADADLNSRVLMAIKNSGMIPSDIPVERKA